MDSRAYELLREGNSLMDRRRDAAAIPLLELAKILQPNKGSILEALGRAYFNDRRPDDACVQFEDALRIDPANHWAHFCLSLCLGKLGRMPEAIGHLRMATAMIPENELYRETLKRFTSRLDRDTTVNGPEKRNGKNGQVRQA